MKRLVTLFFVLAVCGTGAVAQEGAYKTVKDIAYRDAAGDGNIDTMCRLDIYYPVGKTGFSTVATVSKSVPFSLSDTVSVRGQ